MSAIRSHTRGMPTLLLDCVVDHRHALVKACPFIDDTVSQLVHIFDFLAVNLLRKNATYSVIDRVEVWTIWRPQWRRDEVWCQALQQIDRLLCAVSRCRILLETEVIWEFFDISQKFLHEVVLTIYFHSIIHQMMIIELQCRHSDRHNEQCRMLADTGQQLGAMSSFCKKIFNKQHILKPIKSISKTRPVNELSFTNLHPLVCFLRTK